MPYFCEPVPNKSRAPTLALAFAARLLAFARLLRELNLDVAPPEAPRPNQLKYPK